MARKPSRLKVVITPAARRDFNAIWFWNAERYGADHADAYETFLESCAKRLEVDHHLGRPVPSVPEFKYTIARKAAGGHGHYIIFQVQQGSVEILRLFHTRQDWESRFREGR